jgi:parvulin-like peptidyl-prolyl isomerase
MFEVLLCLAWLAAPGSAAQDRPAPDRPALGAVRQTTPAPIRPPQPGDVVVIDGVPIPGDEYGRWMLDLFGSRMAHRFAEQWLVRRAAEARGVALPPDAVDGRMDTEIAERIRGAFLGKRDDWIEELRRLDTSEGGYRRRRGLELEPELLATELAKQGRVVPEELVVRDWQLFYGPDGREYTLSGIKVDVEVVMPREKAAREEYEAARKQAFAERLAKALEIRERILDGEDFAKLARAQSDDVLTRASGGRFSGKFRPPGWHELFVKTLASVPVGELSMPIYAKGGYWIMRVDDVVVTPLESVRAEITQRLVELGPESFEVAATWKSIVEGMKVEVLPAMYEAPTTSPENREPVIGMLINGQPVERAEFALWLLHSRGEHYARDFAEHYLVERKAEQLGVKVTDAELGERLVEHQQWIIDRGYKGSREAWKHQLESQGRDEAGWEREWRRRKRIDLLAEKLMLLEKRVDDEALREYWKKIYGEQGRWLEARMVLVAIPPPRLSENMTRELLEERIVEAREAARIEAQRVYERLNDGEDFASLARAVSSDDATKLAGGRLPGRFRPDQWPPEVGEAVMKLEVGQITPPLDTGRGFGIFEVLESRAVEFESVRDELEREILSERIPQGDLAGYRNVLFRQAQLEVRPDMYK